MAKIELGFGKQINWAPVNDTLPKTVDKLVNFESMTEKQKKMFDKSYNMKIMLGYLCAIIPGLIMSGMRKSKWKAFISQTKFDWEKLVTESFNSFENVHIDGKSAAMASKLNVIRNTRPSGIPSDSVLFNVLTLLDGTIDALKFSTFFVTYRATRTRKVGDTYQTYYVYDHRVVVYSEDINSSFKDFNMHLVPNGIMNKKANLENPQFNKLFSIDFNDEQKLRKLFTPAVQENMVMAAQKAKDINVVIGHGQMIINLNIATNMGDNLNALAATKPRPEKELEGLIVSHVMRDLQNIATALSIANIFRNLQEIFK